MFYFFIRDKHEIGLLKTKYGQTIENGEGLHSDVWKGTLISPQYGLVFILGMQLEIPNEA